MRKRRIIVTGASGLLGNAVARHLGRWADVIPLANRSDRPGLWRGDLLDPAVLSRLADEPWDAMVHGAAFRSPDFCEIQPELAERLNAVVPVELSRLARQRGALFIHVSTDYVFDGTRAPYHEADPCHPVNVYGQTKRRAEEGVMAENPDAIIMRIGALFGVPEPGIPSPMLEEAIQCVLAGRPAGIDHRIKRYPLFVEDVARTVQFLLECGEARGIVHVGSSRAVTRYEWALRVAALLGRSSAHLRPSDIDLGRPALRPVDVGMATDRLRSWGGPVPRDLDETLPEVLGRCRPIVEDEEKKLSDANPA